MDTFCRVAFWYRATAPYFRWLQRAMGYASELVFSACVLGSAPSPLRRSRVSGVRLIRSVDCEQVKLVKLLHTTTAKQTLNKPYSVNKVSREHRACSGRLGPSRAL